MKRIAKTIPIFILAALLLATAVIFVAPANVAYAASVNFVIVGETENSWTLFVEEADGRREIATSTECFFDYENNDAASVLFLQEINNYLSEQDTYALAFELPGFNAQENGNSEIKYSDSRDGEFSVSATELTSVINPKNESGKSSMRAMLQYRMGEEGYSADKVYGSAQEAGDPIFFGRQRVGEYHVRYVAVENFRFGNREYSVRRYSEEEFSCKIVQDYAPAPSITSVQIEYGTSAGEIGKQIGYGGTWTLSEQEGVSADTYPKVEAEPHKMKFDYVSDDPNYLPLEGIELEIIVTPKPIIVYIGDLYSEVDDPPADLQAYLQSVKFFTSALVANDAAEDLALEFFLLNEDNIDYSVPGSHIISARCANKNYTVNSCVNSVGSPIIPGGRYTVYQDVYTATAPDGRNFKVYCDSWTNREITVTIENSRSLTLKGDVSEGASDFYLASVAYYTVIFVDAASGNRVYPTDTFTLEWEGEIGEAQYVLLANSENSDEMSETQPYTPDLHSVTFGKSSVESADVRLDSVVFLKEVTIYPSEANGNVWQWYNILLLAICCALATALAAIGITAAKRRRRIWRH